MLSYYCLKKYRKLKFKSCKNKKQECFYQNVQCVIIKNQNLLKRKKIWDY